MPNAKPNIVCVFADQMRAQATGFAGDPNVVTPNLDALARDSVVFETAACCLPLCTPYRACLLTGLYPHSTGVFMNDIALPTDETTIAHAVKEHGYDTAYIGKWHLDGPHPRAFTPPGPRRQGFDHWAAYNMGHAYYESVYFRDADAPVPYGDYEPKVQTEQAIEYIDAHAGDEPFFLCLSYATPHDPYDQVPSEYREQYTLDNLVDRPNFMTAYGRDRGKMQTYAERYADEPKIRRKSTIYRGVVPDISREEIMGYYAHITALDEYVGRLRQGLERNGLAEDTIFLFTSDHGDMLGSHRKFQKQWPHDESILAPFILSYPRRLSTPRSVKTPINAVDIMPTLLGLAGLPIPPTVEGSDLSHCALGEPRDDDPEGALIMAVSPFLSHPSWGMREYRGVRTARYTYTRTLEGPWHLFDNETDPYQLENLINPPEHAPLQASLEALLASLLEQTGDDFAPDEVHRERAGIYVVKDDDAIPTW